ncbi:MAG: hypothetical protein NVS2B11_00540 [Acetobacteraceae bacterium]
MRGLKVAVVAMGVLILAGTGVIVTVLLQRISATPGAIASVLLDEPAGTRIVGSSLAQDRLAVQLQGGGPDRLVPVDTRSGRVLGRIGLSR